MSATDECDCKCQAPKKYVQKRCNAENPYISIRKVVKLMDDPISTNCYERQLFIIDDFLDACPYAFVSFIVELV